MRRVIAPLVVAAVVGTMVPLAVATTASAQGAPPIEVQYPYNPDPALYSGGRQMVCNLGFADSLGTTVDFQFPETGLEPDNDVVVHFACHYEIPGATAQQATPYEIQDVVSMDCEEGTGQCGFEQRELVCITPLNTSCQFGSSTDNYMPRVTSQLTSETVWHEPVPGEEYRTASIRFTMPWDSLRPPSQHQSGCVDTPSGSWQVSGFYGPGGFNAHEKCNRFVVDAYGTSGAGEAGYSGLYPAIANVLNIEQRFRCHDSVDPTLPDNLVTGCDGRWGINDVFYGVSATGFPYPEFISPDGGIPDAEEEYEQIHSDGCTLRVTVTDQGTGDQATTVDAPGTDNDVIGGEVFWRSDTTYLFDIKATDNGENPVTNQGIVPARILFFGVKGQPTIQAGLQESLSGKWTFVFTFDQEGFYDVQVSSLFGTDSCYTIVSQSLPWSFVDPVTGDIVYGVDNPSVSLGECVEPLVEGVLPSVEWSWNPLDLISQGASELGALVRVLSPPSLVGIWLCVAEYMIVPATPVQVHVAGIRSDLDRTAVGVIVRVVEAPFQLAIKLGNTSAGSCQGPTYEHPISGSGGQTATVAPFNACGSMAAVASMVKTGLSVLAYFAAALFCIRIVSGAMGYDSGVSASGAED